MVKLKVTDNVQCPKHRNNLAKNKGKGGDGGMAISAMDIATQKPIFSVLQNAGFFYFLSSKHPNNRFEISCSLPTT
jgi:hypothetical protein